jgi:hypothetical protein
MWRDRRHALHVPGGGGPRDSVSVHRYVRRALPLLLAMTVIPIVSAEEIAVRIRDDGRVDVRVTAAPLASVLDRLAWQTEMSLAYQGPPPRRAVTLAVYASNQARAVLDILDDLGVDYAMTLDPTGTRILSLVVADASRPGRANPDTSEPPALQGVEPVPAAAPEARERVDESEAAGAANPAEGFPLLPGDFVPGGRATGQTTEWGMPPFVLPDPPDAPVASTPQVTPPEAPSSPAPKPTAP